MAHPLDGIGKRFERADENIPNLHGEIQLFIQKSGYASVVERDAERRKQFHEFWQRQEIPPRFGVLVSEILHHYRAALDNLYWKLVEHGSGIPASEEERLKIQFPISRSGPLTAAEITKVQGKVQGVIHGSEAIIDSLQPYHGIPKPNALLRVLHDMNRFDKHRELAIIETPVQERPEFYIVQAVPIGIAEDGTEIEGAPIMQREVYVGMKLIPVISFREFGVQGRPLAVIRGLREIGQATAEAIHRFDKFFPR